MACESALSQTISKREEFLEFTAYSFPTSKIGQTHRGVMAENFKLLVNDLMSFGQECNLYPISGESLYFLFLSFITLNCRTKYI